MVIPESERRTPPSWGQTGRYSDSWCEIAITQVILAEVPGFRIACERGSAEKSRNLFANVQLACRIVPLLLVFCRFVAGKSKEINGT